MKTKKLVPVLIKLFIFACVSFVYFEIARFISEISPLDLSELDTFNVIVFIIYLLFIVPVLLVFINKLNVIYKHNS